MLYINLSNYFSSNMLPSIFSEKIIPSAKHIRAIIIVSWCMSFISNHALQVICCCRATRKANIMRMVTQSFLFIALQQ